MQEGIEPLAQELLKRKMAESPEQFQPEKPFDLGLDVPEGPKPIPPEIAALLAGATDAASTYAFLKKGVGTEANPLYKGFQNDPLKTALGVGAGSLGMMGIRNLIRRMGPTGHKIADTLAGAQAGEQFSIGMDNFNKLDVPYPGRIKRSMDERGSFAKTKERLMAGISGTGKGK